MTTLRMMHICNAIVLALLASAWGCEETTQKVSIAGREFDLELAIDDEARTAGLMHRPTLAEDGGMLFVFPDAQPRMFWMKNTLIRLDAIFLDESGYIVHIAQMSPPIDGSPDELVPRYACPRPCQYVIELNGGMAAKLGLELGQRIVLPFESLKRRLR